jgi:hypothetical protein
MPMVKNKSALTDKEILKIREALETELRGMLRAFEIPLHTEWPQKTAQHSAGAAALIDRLDPRFVASASLSFWVSFSHEATNTYSEAF